MVDPDTPPKLDNQEPDASDTNKAIPDIRTQCCCNWPSCLYIQSTFMKLGAEDDPWKGSLIRLNKGTVPNHKTLGLRAPISHHLKIPIQEMKQRTSVYVARHHFTRSLLKQGH
jgi:hypothetical protein